jgi:hypothetical protein
MKTPGLLLLFACVSFVPEVKAQGTFIYDQQSSDENQLGGGVADITSSQPIGQSFTPSLSAVGFVRLYLSDGVFNGLGTTVYVNLRANSITGNVLAATSPVSVGDRFVGSVDFLFASNIAVTPQAQYYFQPVVQSGQSFGVYAYNSFGYSGGTAFSQGIVVPGWDLWFREGLYVPEPSSAALGLLGAAQLVWARRRRFPVP